ncbi:MAG: hypothetical protein Unbinned3849contig1000_24 [Prokaryotic dsDNA virus sp.]|nr:MAG: hypothetical protein Unbinned3849contig1000_24 [Prokaryotic dsDNA virus sp.]|tara:strand:- start:20297 stop:21046 length:750 start_codon:yes stop_codon:yes gene_type:complete
MKTLYIDLENGYKSLGSKSDIKKMFGYQPLSFETFSDFGAFVKQIWTRKKTVENIDIDGIPVAQESYKITAKEGTSIEGLVIDTGSEMAKKYVRELKGKNDALKLQQWGKLKDILDAFFSYLNSIPCSTIVNCHSKAEQDNENGIIRMMPYIEGSTKVDVGKWFDFVFYTRITKMKDGTRKYLWVTQRDEHYCHAKDRSNSLPPEIEQDYSLIFDVVKSKGWDSAKVMIIGEPGSGKTMSLKTLTKVKG